MRAFHNDHKVKDFYIARVKEHIDLNEIVQGTYFENGNLGERKMCGVGCTIHGSEHEKYETELGIPRIMARLEDRIFENLPIEIAKTWPLRFLEAINVGADLSKVWPKFAIYLLTHESQCNSRHEQCKIVADCYQRQLNGEKIDWISVRIAAAAAAGAAYAAPYAAATYAAAAAAAAAYAATYAATYAAAAYKKAKQQAALAQSEKLLELLKEPK